MALPEKHPLQTDDVGAALTAVYTWNYDSEVDQVRTLYANALERQWIGMRDLDWDGELDREAICQTFSMGGIPIADTEFWKSLPPRRA